MRNQHDLNVTSMPPKYRRMADFHEYYSGARTAPYLTIFIGGNHEASNHLFELYYGGWVAPNIYYLGAANVIRFGPLRIAGLTGIWKGYDYRKPHFERLPYNREEIASIYHVRELDVRKLLSLRSQVDIGLSHDWPQGIEFHGDYEWLFRSKRGFEADAYSGKLGSVAARQCLDRLRPPYWFSAHLHTKFAAILQHDEKDMASEAKSKPLHSEGRSFKGRFNVDHDSIKTSLPISSAFSHINPKPEDQQKVSAWQQFHVSAQREDAEDRDKVLRDRENQKSAEEASGSRPSPQHTFNETFKKVGTGDNGLQRTIVETTQSQVGLEEHQVPIPTLDGCFLSRPAKRQRLENDEQNTTLLQTRLTSRPAASDQVDGTGRSKTAPPKAAVANPDAIDIEMSDEDEELPDTANEDTTPRAKPLDILNAIGMKSEAHGDAEKQDVSQSMSQESEDGGVKLNPQATSFIPLPSIPAQGSAKDSCESASASTGSSDAEFNPLAKAFDPQQPLGTETTMKPSLTQPKPDEKSSEVSEEMRAQLAALSSNFSNSKNSKVEVSPPLPFPEEIINTTTSFLALGKCEVHQEFLQLLEVHSITSPDKEVHRPLNFSYDPEWLAIQRVFAPELQLGCNASDKVPPYRGEMHYREQILKEQEWITENVVQPGRLTVPENWTITAPVYDPNLQVNPDEMPRELTNPQTSAFCELIGIENKFDISEEERNFRMQQGPRPVTEEFAAYESRSREGGRGGRYGGGEGYGGGKGRGGHGGDRGGGRGGGRRGGRGRGRGR